MYGQFLPLVTFFSGALVLPFRALPLVEFYRVDRVPLWFPVKFPSLSSSGAHRPLPVAARSSYARYGLISVQLRARAWIVSFALCVLNFYDPALGFCNLSGIFCRICRSSEKRGWNCLSCSWNRRLEMSRIDSLALQLSAVVFDYANHSQICYRVGCSLID